MRPSEIVEVLKRTSIPTIVCEGDDDVIALRKVTEKLGESNLTILPCGGKENLIEVFLRRNEYRHDLTLFFADKDMWFFTGIPIAYRDIIFTYGYSIENDLIAFSNVEGLLEPTEQIKYKDSVNLLCVWFAREVERFLQNNGSLCDVKARRILTSDFSSFDSDFPLQYDLDLSPSQLSANIYADYELELRGKNLLELLTAFLNTPARKSKYSRLNILEIATSLSEIPCIADVNLAAEQKFFQVK
jgi:hypothetical protein